MPPKGTAHKVKPKPKPRPPRAAEVDLEKGVFLADYESGRKPGGLKAWKQAHDQLTQRFYEGRPLPETLPSRELNQHLDEASFASRERGRQAIMAAVPKLIVQLQNTSKMRKEYLDPFEAMSPSAREAIILKALAQVARDNDSVFSWQHKLAPELTLDRLLADKGLEAFLSSVYKHLLKPDLAVHPFPNDLFLRKFGISTTGGAGEFPPSKANRAFADEYSLIRQSHLQIFIAVFFACMAGTEDKLSFATVGNVAADLSARSAPHAAEHAATTSPGKSVASSQTNLQIERCTWSSRSAEQVKTPKLHRYGTCLKIGRIQLYCSRDCQVSDFSIHRTTCGQLLSEVRDVPVFSKVGSPSSLHPLRGAVLRLFDDSPNEFWGFIGDGVRGTFGYVDKKLDEPTTMRIRRCMRKVAYSALRDDDRDCIDLLALLVIQAPPRRVAAPYKNKRPGMSEQPFDQYSEVVSDFKVMFNLSDEDVAAARERGKVVLEKGEYSGAKELYVRYEEIRAEEELRKLLTVPGLAELANMLYNVERLSGTSEAL